MATTKDTKKIVKKVVKKAEKKVVSKPKEVKAEAKLNPLVWDVKLNADLVAQVLYVQQSNARQGNAHAKSRADVSGGGRKPWRQKGTGRARHGSIRSPLWRKGGVTFTPNNRNWDRKINKQMVKKAVCMLLSERLRNGELEFVKFDSKTTKTMRESIVSQVGKVRGLVISDSLDAKQALSNVQKIDLSTPSVFSVSNLIKAKKVLVDSEVINVIETRLTNGK